MTNQMNREELITYLQTTDDDIKVRRKIVAENTFEYFSDGKSNHDDEEEVCVYRPIGKLEGCAIGRLLPLSTAKNLKGASVEDSEVWNVLPDYVTVLGMSFLSCLQCWHDVTGFRKKIVVKKYYE